MKFRVYIGVAYSGRKHRGNHQRSLFKWRWSK